MSCGNLRRFDEEKIELWVVDEGVLSRILKDIDNPVLEEQLRRKMIVVPMSLYNSIVCNARVDDGEQIKFIKQSAKITNVLTDIMIRATSCEDEYENVTFFRCNYLSNNEDCKLGIRFAFIVNVGMGGACSTVKFCERNIKSITEQICCEEKIDLIGYVPEVKFVYNVGETWDGRYVFEFD